MEILDDAVDVVLGQFLDVLHEGLKGGFDLLLQLLEAVFGHLAGTLHLGSR